MHDWDFVNRYANRWRYWIVDHAGHIVIATEEKSRPRLLAYDKRATALTMLAHQTGKLLYDAERGLVLRAGQWQPWSR